MFSDRNLRASTLSDVLTVLLKVGHIIVASMYVCLFVCASYTLYVTTCSSLIKHYVSLLTKCVFVCLICASNGQKLI